MNTTTAPRRILAAALAAAVLLAAAFLSLSQGVSAGSDRVQEMLAIAAAKWGPVCGGTPITVVRDVEHKLPRERLAAASWNWPPGGEDDPSRYFNCKITYKLGHIPWPSFCSAGIHEEGHMAHWRAKPGREYVYVDKNGHEIHDFTHSASPASIMYPSQETIWPACRAAQPGTHNSSPRKLARRSQTQLQLSPLVLLLPGGGWQHADPDTMRPWVDDFTRHGIRSRAITYPLKDVTAAIAYVAKVAAAERGPVVAYGISAGGTIAAALAATGTVAGAVNIAGPTDFTRWDTPAGVQIMRQIGMRTYAQKRAASPYWMLNGRQSPQLVQCGLADPLVTWDQCSRYASAAGRGQPDTRLQAMANAHAQWPIDRDRAREWIAARWPS